MQDYSNPASRNTMRAAGNPMKTGAAIGGGGNQTQGAGTLPSKVSVPLPGTDKTQARQGGGMKAAPAGFNNGLIAGKI
ncbi:hypothetical protein UFOVP123_7 [uncultured Caudovirales phage]|uniref:Uncharacterized protein n=1 Tax=uncultured Caudovirales phage TaxID=2100421 RepID=A0A6J5LFT3_9CAUD|nr:hypothetical protein UFOVP123_7 [uncultured Caudovirales phage]